MDIKSAAKRILSQMTLEEKIGQVTQLSFNGQPIEEMAEIIRKIKPGSFILCGSALGGSEKQREVCLDAINELYLTVHEGNCFHLVNCKMEWKMENFYRIKNKTEKSRNI